MQISYWRLLMPDVLDDTIDDCLARMVSAWDAGDASAYAAEFTEDASYVIYVGLTYFGRAAIERAHVPVFEKWQKGSRMAIRVLERRMLDRRTAVVVTEGGIGKRGRIHPNKVQTFTMVWAEDRWRCAAFQNTKKNRLFIRLNRAFETDPRPRG
jgi:uncharacterized protein (TIGR02246 family)